MKIFKDYTVGCGTDVLAIAHTRASPLSETFAIDKGLITMAGVYFPPGCVGRVHAKVFFQEHQILPRNQESWCHGENGWWEGKLFFPVDAAPLTIKVVAFQEITPGVNLTWDHTITVAIELTPFNMIPMWGKLLLSLKKIGELLGIEVN